MRHLPPDALCRWKTMTSEIVKQTETVKLIHQLMTACGADPSSFDGSLVIEMIQTCIKLLLEGHETGQIKLLNRALKEMRYAYRIFNQYPKAKRVSIFGSARTPKDHPDYKVAVEFSAEMALSEWMAITGAAEGIMKAGHEGALAKGSFGLSIQLPFESNANSVIEGDPKLINFRYFFTRKLMFLSHAHGVAAFPGGYGTQDELYECLTLMQTGKANIIPVVLLEGVGGDYWVNWENELQRNIVDRNFISLDDKSLYYRAPGVTEGVNHILQFYKRFHSYRYVRDFLVIRMMSPLTPEQVDQLNTRFSPTLVREGKMDLRGAFPEESDHLDLPRLSFVHTKRHFAVVRELIDAINEF